MLITLGRSSLFFIKLLWAEILSTRYVFSSMSAYFKSTSPSSYHITSREERGELFLSES